MTSISSDALNNTTRNATLWKMLRGKEFDPIVAREWMAENWHGSIYLAGVYLLFLIVGGRLMRNRAAFKLNKQLIVWNALLTIFSAVGTYYTLPEFLGHLKKYGYFASYCVVDGYYLKEPSAFWVWAFHLSKAPELGDTIFLILRKRPVSFLHLFHHTTVVLWCWYCYPFQSAPPRWGVALNYAVHTIMYAYYTARAARFRISSSIPPMITLLQLLQFAACVPLNCLALYLKSVGSMSITNSTSSANESTTTAATTTTLNRGGCETTLTLVLLQQFLYGSYFILFANFFYQTYVVKEKGAKKQLLSSLKQE